MVCMRSLAVALVCVALGPAAAAEVLDFEKDEAGEAPAGFTMGQTGPALDAALASGFEATAIHNHFVFDRPPVFFMHIGGHGEPRRSRCGREGRVGRDPSRTRPRAAAGAEIPG